MPDMTYRSPKNNTVAKPSDSLPCLRTPFPLVLSIVIGSISPLSFRLEPFHVWALPDMIYRSHFHALTMRTGLRVGYVLVELL